MLSTMEYPEKLTWLEAAKIMSPRQNPPTVEELFKALMHSIDMANRLSFRLLVVIGKVQRPETIDIVNHLRRAIAAAQELDNRAAGNPPPKVG